MTILIIDDEQLSIKVIGHLLEKEQLKGVNINTCHDPFLAKGLIQELKPELIFLDIQMPGLNGFQILDSLSQEDLSFQLIFTTSFDQYAIKAIKYSAFDYLLKPIDDEEFRVCMQRVEKHRATQMQLKQLQKNLKSKKPLTQLTVGHISGLSFIQVQDIVMMQSDNNYTRIFLNSGECIVASKTLAHFDRLLEDHDFYFRSHKQFIVNIKYIKEYIGGDENTIVLKYGQRARLARSKRKQFLSTYRM